VTASLPTPTNAPLLGGPVLRWGIVAPGGIGHDWVAAVREHTDQQIVAVGSRSAERAAEFARQHAIPRAYGAVAALVEDPGVDAVYVAAPHSEHARLALAAIAAGKHVLVEKPFTTTVADARAVAAAARDAGVFAMEAMWSRFLPQTTVIDRLLRDGEIGEPVHACAQFGGAIPVERTSRLFDPALGGGCLLDLGVYTSWFVRFTLGPGELAGVLGHIGETGVEDHAVLTTRHGGATGVSASSFAAELPSHAFVSGTRGRIEIEPPFWAPGGFLMTTRDGMLREWSDPSAVLGRAGLAYPVVAAAAHIDAGLLDAPEHPLDAVCDVLGVLEQARARIGAEGSTTQPGGDANPDSVEESA
jgi:predicted dehydrogenase